MSVKEKTNQRVSHEPTLDQRTKRSQWWHRGYCGTTEDGSLVSNKKGKVQVHGGKMT
jgi:hypothetical protein